MANNTCLNTQIRENMSHCHYTYYIAVYTIVNRCIVLKNIRVILCLRNLLISKKSTYSELSNTLTYLTNFQSFESNKNAVMLSKASLAIKYLLFVFNLIIFVSLI